VRPTHGEYRPEIDGLRAFAVGAVVFYHAVPTLVPGGFVGVDVFFVISGFLISGIIARRLDQGSFRLADFYAARVRRIFPALIVVLAAVLVGGWFLLLANEYRSLGRHVAGGAFFLSNFVLWNDVSYFDPVSANKPLLHLWSLGIEEQFYLLWPVSMILAVRFRALTVAVALASLAYSLWLTPLSPAAAYYSPLSRAWELMAGALVAFFPVSHPRAREAAPFIGIAMILASCILFTRTSPFPGWRALLPVVGTALIIGAGPTVWANRTILAWRPFVGLGLISYPLYLWHWPLLAFPFILNFQETVNRWVRLAMVLLAVVLAALTYRLIEIPSRRWTSLRQLVAMMIALGGVVADVAIDGLPGRYANRDPQRRFVEDYVDLHRYGPETSFSHECDFYDWRRAALKPAISPGCTPAGAKVLVWGDSHARSIAIGLRQALPGPFAQIGTSGCPPSLHAAGKWTPGGACDASNGFARRFIAKAHPETVIMGQKEDHEATDWHAIARWLHSHGVRHVILFGPLPEWYPSLPAIVAKHYWGRDHRRVAIGLDQATFRTDRALAARYAGATDFTLIRPIAKLCSLGGCLAQVPGEQVLMAVDYAHLSLAASGYLARLEGPEITAALVQTEDKPTERRGHGQ